MNFSGTGPSRPGPESTIEALRKKAHSAVSDAEALQKHGSPEATINRAYYATFQSARAALLTEEKNPNSHSGVIRRFGYYFVRTGQVSNEIGDILTDRAGDARGSRLRGLLGLRPGGGRRAGREGASVYRGR